MIVPTILACFNVFRSFCCYYKYLSISLIMPDNPLHIVNSDLEMICLKKKEKEISSSTLIGRNNSQIVLLRAVLTCTLKSNHFGLVGWWLQLRSRNSILFLLFLLSKEMNYLETCFTSTISETEFMVCIES